MALAPSLNGYQPFSTNTQIRGVDTGPSETSNTRQQIHVPLPRCTNPLLSTSQIPALQIQELWASQIADSITSCCTPATPAGFQHAPTKLTERKFKHRGRCDGRQHCAVCSEFAAVRYAKRRQHLLRDTAHARHLQYTAGYHRAGMPALLLQTAHSKRLQCCRITSGWMQVPP